MSTTKLIKRIDKLDELIELTKQSIDFYRDEVENNDGCSAIIRDIYHDEVRKYILFADERHALTRQLWHEQWVEAHSNKGVRA